MGMRKLLVSWWRPPDLEDPEEQRIAAVTLPLATISALVLGLWIPVSLIFFIPLWAALTSLDAMGCAASAALVRARRARAGARVLVATALLSITAALTTGGVEGSIPSLYALAVVAAGCDSSFGHSITT